MNKFPADSDQPCDANIEQEQEVEIDATDNVDHHDSDWDNDDDYLEDFITENLTEEFAEKIPFFKELNERAKAEYQAKKQAEEEQVLLYCIAAGGNEPSASALIEEREQQISMLVYKRNRLKLELNMVENQLKNIKEDLATQVVIDTHTKTLEIKKLADNLLHGETLSSEIRDALEMLMTKLNENLPFSQPSNSQEFVEQDLYE